MIKTHLSSNTNASSSSSTGKAKTTTTAKKKTATKRRAEQLESSVPIKLNVPKLSECDHCRRPLARDIKKHQVRCLCSLNKEITVGSQTLKRTHADNDIGFFYRDIENINMICIPLSCKTLCSFFRRGELSHLYEEMGDTDYHEERDKPFTLWSMNLDNMQIDISPIVNKCDAEVLNMDSIQNKFRKTTFATAFIIKINKHAAEREGEEEGEGEGENGHEYINMYATDNVGNEIFRFPEITTASAINTLTLSSNGEANLHSYSMTNTISQKIGFTSRGKIDNLKIAYLMIKKTPHSENKKELRGCNLSWKAWACEHLDRFGKTYLARPHGGIMLPLEQNQNAA